MTDLLHATGDAVAAAANPWGFQDDAIEFALARDGALFDIGMGGGKTLTTLRLAERIDAQLILVICPKSVQGTWPREIAEARDKGIELRDYVTWSGKVPGRGGRPLANPSTSRQAVALLDAVKLAIVTKKPLLATVNFDGCWRGDMARLLLGTEWDLLVIDESHRIKAPGGKASRKIGDVHPAPGIAARVRARGGKIVALTGTPMPHSELDIYAQARAVAPDVFGTNFARFKARYAGRKVYKIGRATDCAICEGTGSAGEPNAINFPCGYCDGWGRHGDPVFMVGPNDEALWVVGQKPRGHVIRPARDGEPIYAVGPRGEALYEGIDANRHDDFTAALQRFVFRVPQDELDRRLGLEEPVDVVRTCELLPATRRVYDDLEKDLIAQLGDGDDLDSVVTAANRMVLTGRLAQLSGGFTKTPDGDLVYVSDPPEKARLLEDVLEDISPDDPVVVFGRFHADLDAIAAVADRLGRRYAELSGRRRDGLTDDSRLNPDAAIVGVQLKSGGVGVDFTRARYGIYYSLDHSLGDHDQSRKRLHRKGQANRVTFIYLLAENTIDQAIRDALKRRRDVIRSVLDRLNHKENTP
jgi:SNF2 family DNA or RNA helicase